MNRSEATLDVLESLTLLRRALHSSPHSDSGTPKLPVGQVQVLLHLAQHGPTPMGELARQLGVSCPAATDLIDRLVAAGRAERAPSPTDRRKILVQLTPAAQQLAEQAFASRRDKVAAVLETLPEDERTGFVRGMRILAQALSASVGVYLAEPLLSVLELAQVAAS